MATEGSEQTKWQGIKRFNKGIILSLVGFSLVLLERQVDLSLVKTVLSLSGYILAVAGFMAAGSGMAHYWRHAYTKGNDEEENKVE